MICVCVCVYSKCRCWERVWYGPASTLVVRVDGIQCFGRDLRSICQICGHCLNGSWSCNVHSCPSTYDLPPPVLGKAALVDCFWFFFLKFYFLYFWLATLFSGGWGLSYFFQFGMPTWICLFFFQQMFYFWVHILSLLCGLLSLVVEIKCVAVTVVLTGVTVAGISPSFSITLSPTLSPPTHTFTLVPSLSLPSWVGLTRSLFFCGLCW